MGFMVGAKLKRVRPLKDGSISVNFRVNDTSGLEKIKIIDSLDYEGWLLFKPNPVKKEEVPDGDVDSKSRSLRLRNTLYRVWESQVADGDFESWYKHEVERIINHYKQKI